MQVFDETMSLLSKSMDLYMVRHNVIADNIANAETPGFKSRRVDFEKELSGVMDDILKGDLKVESSIQRRLASVTPTIYEDPEAEVGLDRNSVDMDREMAALSKNDIKYSAASEMISRRFALMKYAIMEGNR